MSNAAVGRNWGLRTRQTSRQTLGRRKEWAVILFSVRPAKHTEVCEKDFAIDVYDCKQRPLKYDRFARLSMLFVAYINFHYTQAVENLQIASRTRSDLI